MRKTLILAVAALLLLVAGGCERDSSPVDPAAGVLIFSPDKTDSPLSLELLDSLDYEEFAGTIQPDASAMLFGEMRTWPKGCLFSLQISEEALPYLESPLEFSMRIPTYASYAAYHDATGEHLPLIIRLEPANVNFQVPIVVTGTYMPWLTPTPGDLDYATIYPGYENFGPPSWYWVKNRLRVTFGADHFSGWVVGGDLPD